MLRNRLSRHQEIGWWRTAEIDAQRLKRAQLATPNHFTNVVRGHNRDLGSVHDHRRELESRGYLSLENKDGSRTVWLFFQVGKDYNLVHEYLETSERKRVDLTPHGFFWTLPDGNVFAAAKFLQLFGPLDEPFGFQTWARKGSGKYFWQDLGDLWNKMHRFRAITKIWITLDEVEALKKSWLDMQSQLDKIDEAGPLPFGCVPAPGNDCPLSIDSELLAHLEKSDKDTFEHWLNGTSFQKLQEETISLIECELHVQLRSLSTWRATSSPRPGFCLTLIPSSLWSALWYFFARDTTAGAGWRICPHCGKLFYPPRRDRFYCTSELQVQHSRLQWWKEHREEQLAKRKAMRRQSKRAKKAQQGSQA